MVGIGRFAMSTGKYFSVWSRTIRDKEYLVELKLRNFEEKNSSGVKAEDTREKMNPVPRDEVEDEDDADDADMDALAQQLH
jgi:hypothetical protein